MGRASLGKAMLNIPFESARREGLLTHNPCEAVDDLRYAKEPWQGGFLTRGGGETCGAG